MKNRIRRTYNKMNEYIPQCSSCMKETHDFEKLCNGCVQNKKKIKCMQCAPLLQIFQCKACLYSVCIDCSERFTVKVGSDIHKHVVCAWVGCVSKWYKKLDRLGSEADILVPLSSVKYVMHQSILHSVKESN